jgi:hypothetical protein
MTASPPHFDSSHDHFMKNYEGFYNIAKNLGCNIIVNNGSLVFWYHGTPYPMSNEDDDEVVEYREFLRKDAKHRGVFLVFYPDMNGYMFL